MPTTCQHIIALALVAWWEASASHPIRVKSHTYGLQLASCTKATNCITRKQGESIMPKSNFGHIQKLGEDHYRVFWREDGKTKSKHVHGTLDEAEILLATKRIGRASKLPDMTWNKYWDTVVEPSFVGLEERTIYDYRRLWNKELSPRIGLTMVGETSWQYLQHVLLDIQAPSVQRYAKRLLRKICNMAVRDELLSRCPIDRTTKVAPRNKRKKTSLDAADISTFMEAIHGVRAEGILLVELGGGLSHEEACALLKQRMEVFQQNGRIYVAAEVAQALTMVGGEKVLKGTKNGFRQRTVIIGEPFSIPLSALCEGEGCLCPGQVRYVEGEYKAEHFAAPSSVTNNWRRWCERNGQTYVRPSDARTIYSTWHAEAKSPDSLVQMSMGHADGTTRGENYLEFTLSAAIELADSLTAYIERVQAGKSW